MLKYLGMVCGIAGADGYIKKWIDEQKNVSVRKIGKCNITRFRNKGAFYSFGARYPDEIRRLSGVVLLGVLVNWLVVVCSKRKKSLEKWGATFLLSGSISNVWDRFYRKYVVDYIHLDIKGVRNIIFNLSDVCILLGGTMLTIGKLLGMKKEK